MRVCRSGEVCVSWLYCLLPEHGSYLGVAGIFCVVGGSHAMYISQLFVGTKPEQGFHRGWVAPTGGNHERSEPAGTYTINRNAGLAQMAQCRHLPAKRGMVQGIVPIAIECH